MKSVVVLLGQEISGSHLLLQELKTQGVKVDVIGSVPLMASFYSHKEAFFNLHIEKPQLSRVQSLKPDLVLFDRQNEYSWLKKLGVPLVGWGECFSLPSVKDHGLRHWPLPFSQRWGADLFYGTQKSTSAVRFLKEILQ